MKAKRDSGLRGQGGRNLILVLPLAVERPLIELQSVWSSIVLRIILIQSTGRGKVLRSCISDIGFGRLNIVRIRRSFRTAGSDFGHGLGNRSMVSFLEQGPYPLFRFLVSTLAKVVKADFPRGVNKVISRPVFIVEATPDFVVIIHRDRIENAEVLHGF